MSKFLIQKQKSIFSQLEILACPEYRITLKPRRDELKPVNFGNPGNTKTRKKAGIAEKFWTVQELTSEKVIHALTIENMRGFDVYLTPISTTRHYLVVDDTTQDSLAALLAAGYKPCLTQQSSDGNVQAVLIAPKTTSKAEQSLANRLVVRINKEYGDKDFSGAAHPFRLAGFCNKKPGKNDVLTKILTSNPGHICEKSALEMDKIREEAKVSALPTRRAAGGGLLLLPATTDNSAANKSFAHYWQQTERIIMQSGYTKDLDKMDFRCAVSMLAIGYTEAQTAAAMLHLSPHVKDRHKHVDRYITATVRSATATRTARRTV